MIAYLVGIILPVEAFGGMEIRAKRNLALAKKDNMGKFTTKSQYSKRKNMLVLHLGYALYINSDK